MREGASISMLGRKVKAAGRQKGDDFKAEQCDRKHAEVDWK